jgi:DnaK suppressor protein
MNNESKSQLRAHLQQLGERIRLDGASVLENALTPPTGVRGGELSHAPFHLADAGTEEYLSMMNAALLENELQLAEEIRAALARIDEGTFGACEECGQEIGQERLSAIPFTQFCIDCAREAESRGDVRPPDVNSGRPRLPRDTLAPEGEMLESRRGNAGEADHRGLPFSNDEHAAGTPGGGSSLGGLAGTNIGRGEPALGDLGDASGSGESERRQ